MLYRDTVDLIAVVTGYDAEGYPVDTETSTEVFADVASVKRSEFYAGRQAGTELIAAFTVAACDYDGQQVVVYDGARYRVERAYTRDGERMELNCSEDRSVPK